MPELRGVRFAGFGEAGPVGLLATPSGGIATSAGTARVRQSIMMLLSTIPGERVMRPTFGSGLAELVFAPNSPELAATTQFLVQGALQQWLADLVTVDTVAVEAVEARLTVRVIYTLRATGEVQDETFERGIGP